MKLMLLEEGRWNVAAVIHDRDSGMQECPVLNFLQEQSKQYEGTVIGLKAIFERYSNKGKAGLTSDLFHEADKNEKIFQFIKGRLRIYCFVDNGNLIILTHGSVKKTQKADKQEVKRAIRVKQSYIEAAKRKDIEIEGVENGY